jgi:hypothetical protein
VQEFWFSTELNVDAGQSVHVRSVEVVPSCATNVPGGQVVSARHSREPADGAKFVPALQLVQEFWFSTELNVDVGQVVQLRSVEVVPSCATNVPGAQIFSARHSREPADGAKFVPVLQCLHAIVPLPSWNWPAAQSLQVRCSSKRPAGHAAHSRSTNVDPAKEANSPAAHALCAVHVASFGAELNLPLSQTLHSRSDVAVGAFDT